MLNRPIAAMILEKFKCKLQYFLPHHFLSRSLARLANCRVRAIKNYLIKIFIAYYKIDLNIANSSRLSDYATFNEFFTRALKITARPIAIDKDGIVSPADGTISQVGNITLDKLVQAKGQIFTLQKLLGGDTILTKRYHHGEFVTIYLAPRDYHRVHMPIDGKLIRTIYVPGKLFSVNTQSAEYIPDLFCRNERLICLFDTVCGEMALIMVGAMLVAGIETVWGQRETPCSSKQIVIKNYQNENITLAKGQEMGRFQFGSTVILLFGPKKVALSPFKTPHSIKLGELLGKVLPNEVARHGTD